MSDAHEHDTLRSPSAATLWEDLLADVLPALPGFVRKHWPKELAAPDLEELTQEINTHLLSKRGQLPRGGDRKQALGWVWTVIQHKLIDLRRLQARRGRHAAALFSELDLSSESRIGPDLPGRSPPPSWESRRQEFGRVLRECMAEHLSEQQRWALELRYCEGLSAAEAAERMGVTAGHVRNLCSQALPLLRASLSGSHWSL